MGNFRYLWYLLKHKWFVFLSGLDIGVPIYRLILHDLSKLLPTEWLPYLRYFYKSSPTRKSISNKTYNELTDSQARVKKSFDKAWLLHQNRNKHHWQYWLLIQDTGETVPLKMPQKYAKEMVADWVGAGRAITGRIDVLDWYNRNKDKMILHAETREFVEDILYKHYYWI